MPNLQSLSRTLNRLQPLDIVYEAGLCSRVRWRNSKCNLCQEGCVSGALQISPHLNLDEDMCTNCGICISRCQNGVFWSRRRGDAVIAQEISRTLSGSGSHSTVFSCSRSDQPDHDVIVLPCLGRLTENLLLAPFVFGASRVEIRWPACSGCPYEKCLSHLEPVIYFSRKLVATIGQEDSSIQVYKSGKYCKSHPAHDRLSRRDLFHKFRDEATQTVAAFLPEFGNSHQKDPWAQFVGAKRSYLLKLLQAFPRHTATCVPIEKMPLANVEINHRCVGCPVCTTLCPTGALGRIENTDGVDIYFKPEICTGCEICHEACFFQAISLSPCIELLDLVSGKSRQLIHLQRKNCKECSSEFLSIEQEICPTCRQENGDIVAFLKGRA